MIKYKKYNMYDKMMKLREEQDKAITKREDEKLEKMLLDVLKVGWNTNY